MKLNMVVKDSKKSSSSSAAKVVGGGVPPLLRCAEKGTKLRRCDMKKKKIKKNKDMEMKVPPLHMYEFIAPRRFLPEGSKTLYATSLNPPCDRRLAVADFEEFFRDVGKVKVDIQFIPNTFVEDFVKIEFESHDVAKEAMKMDGHDLFDSPINLNGFLQDKPFIKKDCTNERPMISCFGFGKAISGEKLKTELENHFSSVGDVDLVHVPVFGKGLPLLGKGSKDLSKGYAYIKFKNEKSFERAFDLNGTLFLDSTLQVRRANIFVTN